MHIQIADYKSSPRYSPIMHQCQLAAMEKVFPYSQYSAQQQDPYYPVTISITSLADAGKEPKADVAWKGNIMV